jgi:DNA primase large subunit
MSDTATHYVRNENGDVHSVDHDHFELYCHTTTRGRRYLKAGWAELTEAEARVANPQLFGSRDRSIVRTAKELKEIKERRELEAELLGEDDEIEAELLAAAEAEAAAAAESAPASRGRR